MYVHLIAATPNPEKVIEEAGRTCYLSLDHIMGNSSDAFITKAIARGHLSILEHASATFRIEGASRIFTHQLVRHRLASFAQQSQRYVKEDNFEYVIPPSIDENPETRIRFIDSMETNRIVYRDLRSRGIPKEDARFVLPGACVSEIVFTANFREYRHLFELRLDRSAQWEIRQVCTQMLAHLVRLAPAVFSDFTATEEQSV